MNKQKQQTCIQTTNRKQKQKEIIVINGDNERHRNK